MMSRTKSFIAGLGVLAAGCVGPELGTGAQPIINGDSVGDGELRTVGGIATNTGSVCTGTLISPTAVLTAAHCVEPMILKTAMEQAGQTPPEVIEYRFSFARDLASASPDDFLAVESVEWHDMFLQDIGGLFERPGRWHDIAVMHLAEPVTGRPVQQLAPTDVVEALEMGRTHLVAGYGLTVDGDFNSAGVLTRGLSGLGDRGDNELIAGVGDTQQACRGDSGGPIFADDGETYQIGIASRINTDLLPPPSSPPPCETGLLYTRVDSYVDWVAERVPDLGETPDGGGDGSGGDGSGGDGSGGDGSGGDGTGDGGGDSQPEESGGCHAGGGAPTALVALALVALFWRRRALV